MRLEAIKRKWHTKNVTVSEWLAIPAVCPFLLGLASAMLLPGCGGSVGGDGQSQDPVIQSLPIIYIKRPLLADNNNIITDDLRRPAAFNPGAQLFIKAQASPSAREVNLSSGLFPANVFADENGAVLYDVKHLSASFDGQRVLFSAHAPEVDEEELSWNIWEYDIASATAHRVITSDIVAEDGDDLFAAYLPDSRIVFASTRQRQSRALLLDEGKPQFSALDEDRREPALNLHVMNADGSDITQISFNQSHDVEPVVLTDGRIAFIRWDNAGSKNEMNIYQVNPDGTQLELLYGANSHLTGTDNSQIHFSGLKLSESGQLMAIAKPYRHNQSGGDLIRIDTQGYVDFNILATASDRAVNPIEETGSPGQQSLSNQRVNTREGLSVAGRYRSANPLWDGTGRVIVSWTACRLVGPTPLSDDAAASIPTPELLPCTSDNLANRELQEANPLYGLWIFDVANNTQLPIATPEEGSVFVEGIVLQSRSLLPVAQSSEQLNPALAENNLGLVSIKSLYDIDGVDSTPSGIASMADPVQTPAAARPAQFVRIEKPVSLPDEDTLAFDRSAFGFSDTQLMREIVGYVPVEPDGSVRFQVPAGLAFALSVTDHLGRRLTPRHQNWLQVTAGETLTCHGCHNPASTEPHGRTDALKDSVNIGAETTGLPFPNTSPELFADQGETMAETYARLRGNREPSVNVLFDDEWSDESILPKAESYSRSYVDLSTAPPTSQSCLLSWNPLCRVVINYETHIQPLWTLDRRIFDVDGLTLIADHTCIACHSTADADGLSQVPAAQLELTNQPSTDEPDHLRSYRELFTTDFEQELVGGVLVDREELVFDGNGDPVFVVDDNGDLILDVEGNPIQQTQRFTVSGTMTATGAMASSGFFDQFKVTGSHQGWLSDTELRLIAEWLDIGGQYYNNPFDSVAQ